MLVSAHIALEMRVREFGRTASGKDAGATMVEYSLLVALIAVVLIVAVVFFSGGLTSLFDKAGNCMSTAAG